MTGRSRHAGRSRDAGRSRWSGGSRGPATEGYATAEIAVALPVVMIVVLMAVWLLGCVGAQLRCVDAARAAARAAARGDAAAQVVTVGRDRAPRGAEVVVTVDGQVVRVVVTAEVPALGVLLGRLPGVTVSAVALAEREPAPLDAPTGAFPAGAFPTVALPGRGATSQAEGPRWPMTPGSWP